MADKVPREVDSSEENLAAGGADIDPHSVDEEVDTASAGPLSAAGGARAKKAPPEQRRRCMSDKFMLYTYKIKLCKRQDPHNWRLCPYAHPGEAGRRRPPHTYQAVMCDFNKTRKECSHGDKCPLARNALEYWLHPDKYRTILCGHGEACNRNICFFAHNPNELRTPPSAAAAEESLSSELATATGAFQQLNLAPHLVGAAGSSSGVQQRQLFYGDSRAACPLVPGSVGSSSAAAPVAGSQAFRSVQVVGPGGQQQLLVHVPSASDTGQLQQEGIQAGMDPLAATSSGSAAQSGFTTVPQMHPQGVIQQVQPWVYEQQAAYYTQQHSMLGGAQPPHPGGLASPGTGSSTSSMVGPAAGVGPLMQHQMMGAAGMPYYAVPASGVHPSMMGQGLAQQQYQQVRYQPLQYQPQYQQQQQQQHQQHMYYAQQPSTMVGQQALQAGYSGSSAGVGLYVQEASTGDAAAVAGFPSSLQQATAGTGHLVRPTVPSQTAHRMYGLQLQEQPLQPPQQQLVGVATPPASTPEQHYFMPNW